MATFFNHYPNGVKLSEFTDALNKINKNLPSNNLYYFLKSYAQLNSLDNGDYQIVPREVFLFEKGYKII